RSSGCERRYWALPKLHGSRQPHILCATLLTRLCGRNSETPPVRVCTPQRCSGDLLPPSPPAEKATAGQDQAGKASTSDGARYDSGTAQQHVVETFHFRPINEFAANLEFSHI